MSQFNPANIIWDHC